MNSFYKILQAFNPIFKLFLNSSTGFNMRVVEQNFFLNKDFCNHYRLDDYLSPHKFWEAAFKVFLKNIF